MLPVVYDDPEAVAEFHAKLEASVNVQSKKGRGRKFTNQVGSHHISSWKFNEWDYYKHLVPCQARGLFTCESRIVVRGYDKFYNMNEVPNTRFENLSKTTEGPYDLTVKENGCIIFVGGLSDGTLLVCSKHSTGERLDLTRNHATEGEAQLKQQLASIGKSIEELAKLLYEYNITLAMELCDDSFEEHILSYKGLESGLYLHGINFNTIEFKTYPISQVKEFAQQWGFKVVKSFAIDTFDNLVSFLTDVEKLGTWEGREIEGFVIRCSRRSKQAYQDYFFKFKFEQPYLLYRNFREVTKQILSDNNHKPVNEILKRFKTEKYIIAKYIEFIKEYFEDRPDKREEYLNGYGIIELRKLFLKSLGLSEISGMNLLDINEEIASSTDQGKSCNKYVVIPIATIGCGKTTIAYTLKELFDWGHVQNDNISNNKQKNQLVKMSLESLESKPLVIVDRNNHQKRERKQLFDQFYELKVEYLSSNDNLTFIGLNFLPNDLEINDDEIDRITSERIDKRGDNHQSIKNDSDPLLVKKIMRGFISRFQPVDKSNPPDNEFDLIIDVDFRNDTFASVKHVLEQLNANCPDLMLQLGASDVPEDDKIRAAITTALNYKPTFTKTFGSNQRGNNSAFVRGLQTQKKKKPDYFGVSANHESIVAMLQQYCSNNDLWKLLNSIERVQEEFHITLAHISSLKVDGGKPWEALCTLLKAKKKQPESSFYFPGPYKADFKVKQIIVSDVVIFLTVDIVRFYSDQEDEEKPIEVPVLNKYLHITIGTFRPEIKPFVSNVILDKLYKITKDLSENNIYTVEYEGEPHKVQVSNVPEPAFTNQPLFSHYA